MKRVLTCILQLLPGATLYDGNGLTGFWTNMRHLLQTKQSNLLSALVVSAGLLISTTAWSQVKLTPVTPPKTQGKSQLVNSIVVVVNDDVITRQELNERIVDVEMRRK